MVPAEQNPFATFVDQRAKSLIDRVKEVDHIGSKEHIRRVRVGLKRWRTLYQLIIVLMPRRVRSSPVERSVQRLFKRAGVHENESGQSRSAKSLPLPPFI